MRFLKELRRRQVFGVAVIYVAAAWVLIQVADTDVIQDTLGLDARLVLIIAIVGFPIALVAGWSYDITNRGLFRTAPAAGNSFDPHLRARDFGILGVLAIVWAAGVYVVYVPPATDRSIAVLPFENRSNDPDSEIFAFGVRDDLNVHLGRVGQLRVIASNSVDKVDRSLPIERIGDQLGVAYLLKGSVERIAGRIRVNVMLIETADATQSWSSSFDRELSTEGLFDIRSGIADSITSALRAKLTDTEQRGLADRPTQVFAAWEAFVRGRYLLAKRASDSIKVAVREFEEAISLDPDFALAHAELAMSLMLGDCGDTSGAQCDAKVVGHIEMAMVLDPDLAEAHAANGFFLWGHSRVEEALEDLKLATQINRSYSIAYIWMGSIDEEHFSRHNEAFDAFETALRLDPLSIPGNMNYIRGLVRRNRLVEANRQIEKLTSFCPNCSAYWQGELSSIGGNWAQLIFVDLKVMTENDLTAGSGELSWHLAAIGLEKDALLVANGEDPEAMSWFGDPEGGVKLARTNLAKGPTSAGARITMALVLAHTGRYTKARPYMEELWRLWGGLPTRNDWMTSYFAEALVAIRRDAGDEAGVEQVLALLRDNARQLRDAGIILTQLSYSVEYQEGIAAYLAGDHDAGLALISKAAEDGFWVPPASAFQERRFEDPGFAAILERQKARQARERKKVLDVVCNDNPYAVVWQPAEETCAQFLAAGRD